MDKRIFVIYKDRLNRAGSIVCTWLERAESNDQGDDWEKMYSQYIYIFSNWEAPKRYHHLSWQPPLSSAPLRLNAILKYYCYYYYYCDPSIVNNLIKLIIICNCIVLYTDDHDTRKNIILERDDAASPENDQRADLI